MLITVNLYCGVATLGKKRAVHDTQKLTSRGDRQLHPFNIERAKLEFFLKGSAIGLLIQLAIPTQIRGVAADPLHLPTLRLGANLGICRENGRSLYSIAKSIVQLG